MNPSPWILRHLDAVAPGRAIDVAAGSGRHAFAMADLGFSVTAVDRNPDLASLYQESEVQFLCADLEGQRWPLADHAYDLVLVSNYLYRPPSRMHGQRVAMHTTWCSFPIICIDHILQNFFNWLRPAVTFFTRHLERATKSMASRVILIFY